MLDEKIVKLLNEQFNYELFSAYFYLDIHAYYADKNLNGFANWFMIQTQEERDHAMLFLQYILNNSAKGLFPDIKGPDHHFEGVEAPLKATLAHEQFVTSRIHNIYGAALDVKDFRTTQFLDWFVKEQGEEEKNVEDVLKKYELFGADGKGLYLLDQELGARVYTAPTLVL